MVKCEWSNIYIEISGSRLLVDAQATILVGNTLIEQAQIDSISQIT